MTISYNLEYVFYEDSSRVSRNMQSLNNLIDSMATERNIYITASKTECPNDMNNPSYSMFQLAICFIHKTRTSDSTTGGSEAHIHTATREVCCPFGRFASADEAKLTVEGLFGNFEFPYSIDRGGLWKDLTVAADNVVEQVELRGIGELVEKISEAAVRAAREALVSGQRVVELAIMIDKCSVVPHQLFQRLIPRPDLQVSASVLHYDDDDDDDPGSHGPDRLDFSFPSNHSINIGDIFYDDDDDDFPSHLYEVPQPNRAIEQSNDFLESTAAASSGSALLEMFRYKGSIGDGSSKPTECVICMEDVLIGSHLARMPCSHIFHGECISKWLRTSPTCPLCRHKLP